MHEKSWGNILLMALAILLLALVNRNDGPDALDAVRPVTFVGEYRQADGAWAPLTESAGISALGDELELRGTFGCEVEKGDFVNCYLNHIDYSVFINGERIGYSLGMDGEKSSFACGKTWGGFRSPGITVGDVVEIRLVNRHRLGNTAAYREFLDSICVGEAFALKTMLEKEYSIHRTMGVLLMIIAIAVIGIAMAFSAMQRILAGQLWVLGLMSFFMGGYILLDTPDVIFWSDENAFNTCARQVCIMLALYEVSLFLSRYLSTGAQRIARILLVAESVFLGLLLTACLTGFAGICDTIPVWYAVESLMSALRLGCCLYEGWKTRTIRFMNVTFSALMGIMLLELVNVFFAWWETGFFIKFAVLFAILFHVVRGISYLPESYQKSMEADRLKSELKNSRIVLAMSQIRTHFIFNILNAISGMCKYDPEKADRTVVRFARYLRMNIDIMEEDCIASFRTVLNHLEDYIILEQVRFGDRIRFETDITVEDFSIPPLILQPIVENAIKHGLTPKAEGGTILLSTWQDEREIHISIKDDGVGFDPAHRKNGGVGLRNVRFRLENMVGGRIDVASVPGEGTVVTVSIPCKEESE